MQVLTLLPLAAIKRHGGWKSTAVAEGYIDNSIQNKNDISKKIFHTDSANVSCPQLLLDVNMNINSAINNQEIMTPAYNFSNCTINALTINVNK